MSIVRQKLDINGVWDEVCTLGRFLPQLATFAVLTMMIQQHLSAAVVFKTVWFFIAVRDSVCFFCQMAIRNISELGVCFKRFQVGRIFAMLKYIWCNDWLGLFCIQTTNSNYLHLPLCSLSILLPLIDTFLSVATPNRTW